MADGTNHEQLASEFCEVISVSREDAFHFLSVSNWNISHAVATYFGAQVQDEDVVENQKEADESLKDDKYTGPPISDDMPEPSSPIGNSSTPFCETAESKSAQASHSSIRKSVTMRHLCERCSHLRVRDKSCESSQTHRVVESVFKPTYENVEYLVQSSQGSIGRACHFCALILRSLKCHKSIGTHEEETSLPSGPITISFSETNDHSLIATCGPVVGYPIQLSLGMDESCRGSDVSSSASSDQIFSQIQSWSQDCVGKHSRCSIARSSVSWLPSRVVDLGTSLSPLSPKLSETRGAVGRYITLTHRWTKLTGLSATTSANYESRKQSLNIKSLSLTFQDAFQAARKLGVQYIWIDALCIIQDSSEDWEREASNMRSIYEFAWLNIAVAGSEKEDGRLFMERQSRLSRPCKLPNSLLSGNTAKLEGPIYAYLSSQCYAKAVFDGFLTRRGWILQERILSPRTIYFGAEEVFWECSSISASETIPWGWEEHESPIVKFNAYDLALNASGLLETDSSPSRKFSGRAGNNDGVLNKSQNNEGLSPLYRYWYHLVEAYTRKDLTKTTDRLPAIFGLAQALHKSGMPYDIFSKCYKNGVWLSEPTSLLWYLDDSPEVHDSVNTQAPSYSWAIWSNAAMFMANEVDFVVASQAGARSLDEGILEFLGGHPLLQLAQISIPSSIYLLCRPEGTNTANILQITGQVEMAEMNIETSESRVDFVRKRQKLQAKDPPIVSILNWSGGMHLDGTRVILDKYPDDTLEDWLQLSEGTVWLLKIALGKHCGKESTSRWFSENEMGYPGQTSRTFYAFGLVLIPCHEDVEAIKEIQEKLEGWNLPSSTPRRSWERSSPPPMNEKTKYMHAQSRLDAYKLMGPHNTAFRRVGIYRSSASNYSHFKQFETTVLLT